MPPVEAECVGSRTDAGVGAAEGIRERIKDEHDGCDDGRTRWGAGRITVAEDDRIVFSFLQSRYSVRLRPATIAAKYRYKLR